MRIEDLKRAGQLSLVRAQQADGSWSGDDAATATAMEALAEAVFGPDILCRQSWLGRTVSPVDAWPRGWPLAFSYGLRDEGDADPRIAALYTGFQVGHRSSFPRNSWLLAKWIRLFALTDPDFWPHWMPRSIYTWPSENLVLDSDEPWLASQMALARMHFDIPNEGELPSRKGYVLQYLRDVRQAASGDHWSARLVSSEEATALAARFMFHKCTGHLQHALDHEMDPPGPQSVLRWLLLRQGANGSWNRDAATTAQVVDTLRSLRTHESAVALHDEVVLGISAGVRYLCEPDVVASWDSLTTYQQIATFASLMRVAADEALTHLLELRDIVSARLAPTTFISYAGCDAEFVKDLCARLERRGIALWVAEWDLDYGADIVESIQRALDTTRTFVIVLSPEAVVRPWVRKELSAAFTSALDGNDKLIVPLMLRSCDVPSFLRAHKWIDFRDASTRDAGVNELARRLKRQRKARS